MIDDSATNRLDRARELLMRALDDELTEEEHQEMESLLAADPELRAERKRLGRLKEVTTEMKLRNPPEELWDSYWNSTYSRVERGFGWILVSFSVIVVGGWATWQFVTELIADTGMPPLVKAGILAGSLGLVILTVSVLRQRLFVKKTDPYKEIVR
ncbi:MAG: anti-sigma factor family protein [Gemmatimonadota bacterium]